jgi:glucose/arabinose dehydrogenase
MKLSTTSISSNTSGINDRVQLGESFRLSLERLWPLALCALALACCWGSVAAQRVAASEGDAAVRASAAGTLRLRAQRIALPGGGSAELSLPEGFAVRVAASGLRRVRFMALSPDRRVFVTDMYNLADNRRGAVYVLDRFDALKGSFNRVTPYLKNLRNPNSLAFYRDRDGADWLYLALTDRLLRYRYAAGESKPAGEPEVLATFPDYGLSYKYGGWHLTRTVAVGPGGKIYVSVGSSCNACEEKEEVRASIIEMDADGRNQRRYARGLRNAVGLRSVDGHLFATNMGADHLGDHRPADTLYRIEEGANYGWPYCYQSGPRVLADAQYNARGRLLDCRRVPRALAAFDAHSSPLGLEFFGVENGPELSGSWLVALHGSTKKSLGHGYRVVRVRARGARAEAEDFITGFLRGGRVTGRPVDILSFGSDAFLLTDDYAGVVYYVYKE